MPESIIGGGGRGGAVVKLGYLGRDEKLAQCARRLRPRTHARGDRKWPSRGPQGAWPHSATLACVYLRARRRTGHDPGGGQSLGSSTHGGCHRELLRYLRLWAGD